MTRIFVLALFIGSLAFGANTKQPPVVQGTQPAVVSPSTASTARTLKRKVAIARFTNETAYGRSFLIDQDANPIGKQALDILSKKLLDTGKFILLERADIGKINAEIVATSTVGLKNMADYLIVGSITAFGRKTEGDVGVFTRKKRQIAFAKVTIRLIDVQTGQIIYAEEGSGEAFSEQKTALGLGATAGYDSTLNDQVLDAAISNLASRVIENLLGKPWKAYVLAYADGSYIISGGKSQGLDVGDVLSVYLEGRRVTNPQTGMEVVLPGKLVGELRIESFTGEQTNEIAFAVLASGEIPKSEDPAAFANYYIQETK